MPADSPSAEPDSNPASSREVRYGSSPEFSRILEQANLSLILTTYQAGKLVILRAPGGELELEFANFDRPMGLAVRSDGLAVGGRNQVWLLHNVPDIARQLEPPGRFDACFVTRSSHVTGDIQSHQMAWSGGTLWVVNTLFSCLCTVGGDASFVPRWRPPFISGLAPQDRCHLNGMALQDGQPKFATALAQTDTPQGWRPDKATSGCLIDVPSGEIVLHGLAMPHSPVIHDGHIYLLDSGNGQLIRFDPASRLCSPIAEVPGYARGLACAGPLAFVGLSKIRETSTFGGMPIEERRDQLRCGLAVIHLETGETIASFEFTSGVEEIFDVAVLPGVKSPTLRGPHATTDGHEEVWILPGPATAQANEQPTPDRLSD